jgi:hypothetical protein
MQDIGLIPPALGLGALSLDAEPLKLALKHEAGSWKERFARTIHQSAAQGLKVRQSRIYCFAFNAWAGMDGLVFSKEVLLSRSSGTERPCG